MQDLWHLSRLEAGKRRKLKENILHHAGKRSDMKFISIVLIMIIVFFGITFALQNASPVTLKYFEIFDFQMPAYLLIFISLFIGIVLSGLIGLIERFKLFRNLQRLKKEIKALESEIYDIRKNQFTNQNVGPAIKKEYLS